MFLCKDPCGPTPGSRFVEGDLANLAGWFNQTRQPLPRALDLGLPSLGGPPIVYHATQQTAPQGDPPRGRLCVRIMAASRFSPLGVCANDATVRCTSSDDCGGETCGTGTPATINDDPAAYGNIGRGLCAPTSAFNAGSPCYDDDGCDSTPGSCVLLPTTAWRGSCSASPTECNDDAGCPLGQTCLAYCDDPACGDGIVDPDEACDDGDTTAGDGCDGHCTVEAGWACYRTLGSLSTCVPTGTLGAASCDLDGKACTADRCASGSPDCLAGGTPVCRLGDGSVQLKTKASAPGKALLKWKWIAGTDLAAGDLGTPTTSTDLTLCAIDQRGVLFEATAPANDTCAGRPCWEEKDKTTTYKDKDATPDGLVKLQAKWGIAGKGKLQVQGKGALLPFPTALFPAAALETPVRVILARRDAPACWEPQLTTVTKNLAGEFKAKSD